MKEIRDVGGYEGFLPLETEIKEVKVLQEEYKTSDGQCFTDRWDAENHETEIRLPKIKQFVVPDDGLLLYGCRVYYIESIDELELLRARSELNEWCFQDGDKKDSSNHRGDYYFDIYGVKEFPITLIEFEETGTFHVRDKSLYKQIIKLQKLSEAKNG